MEKMKVKLTLIEDILGTLPGDSEIYQNYILTKKADHSNDQEEINIIEKLSGEEIERGATVFVRNDEGKPCVYDYIIKGFFKNACKAMREADGSASKNLKAYKTKIDNLVFVGPRMITLDGDYNISICERPLRASTAQGDRVALSASESIPAGTTLEFEITVLDKSFLTYVVEWLDYGQFNGLGQWHNSGKGRFTWEEIV